MTPKHIDDEIRENPDIETEDSPDLAESCAADKELLELRDRYMRLAAEYDNYRKRSDRERAAVFSDAQSDVILRFLPVYDNLTLALGQECADAAYVKGVEMIMQQFCDTLESFGISAVGAPGEAFDPELHNAVMHIEDDTLGESVIAEVFKKGFRSESRVIRHALVKVAN